ncbi:MAG: DUF5022 domain-containing protein [Acetivibrio ethanolgignens]
MKRVVSILIGTLMLTMSIANSVVCQAAENENYADINKNASGVYLLETDGDKEIAVGRLDIDLSSKEEVDKVLLREDIMPEVKKVIKEKSEKAIESGKNVTATYFSTELLSEKERINSEYYNYKGHQMRSDRLYTSCESTGWQTISNNESAKLVANQITDLILQGFCKVNKYVPLVAAGKTVLDFFKDYYNAKYITASNGDLLQMLIEFDSVDQWTYVEVNGSWTLGATTKKITVTKAEIYQYYIVNNVRKSHTKSIILSNAEQKTKNFDSPWETAWQYHLDPTMEWIEWKAGNKIILF